MMSDAQVDPALVSFTHILNAFNAPPGSEHAVAAKLTWSTLRVAHQHARDRGIPVQLRAVISPGDEDAVQEPTSSVRYLDRTIQDLVRLRPFRPLPLVQDIFEVGAKDCFSSHIIFSNIDIFVRPEFYVSVRDLIQSRLGLDSPFAITRIDLDLERLEQNRLNVTGTYGYGYDCFVIPTNLIRQLDLGTCCIGAPHFDQLLYAELDLLSGHRIKTIADQQLTFHLGHRKVWSTMMDYIEHNLSESLAAIRRLKKQYEIVPWTAFDALERHHFKVHTRWASIFVRKLRRVPKLGILLNTISAYRRKRRTRAVQVNVTSDFFEQLRKTATGAALNK